MEHSLSVDSALKNLSFGAIDDNLGIYYSVELFEDEKARKAYIKSVERLVRTSPEYTKFIKYLRSDLSFNSCAILNELNTENVSIELHHFPFNLYEIVESVITKRIDQEKPLTTFSVSEEVMILHYTNSVGLIPLSKTMHELAHSSKSALSIDPRMVVGDFNTFFNEYGVHLSSKALENFQKWKEFSDMTKPIDDLPNYSSSDKYSTFLTRVSNTNTKIKQL